MTATGLVLRHYAYSRRVALHYAGKSGTLYLMDQNNLGGNHLSTDSVIQRLDSAYAFDPEGGDPVPVFWNNLFFLWSGEDSLRVLAFNGEKFNAGLQSSNPTRQGISGGAITLSASGNSNGIIWAPIIQPDAFTLLMLSMCQRCCGMTLRRPSTQTAGKFRCKIRAAYRGKRQSLCSHDQFARRLRIA